MKKLHLALPCAALLLALSACGQSTPSAPAVAFPDPTDPKLAKLYVQTCKACHTNAGTGAPQAGDKAAWAARLAAGGMPLLIERTLNGYKGMPPLGSCMDCSEAEFETLIRYMAGEGG